MRIAATPPRRTAPHRTDPPKRTGPLVQRLLCCAECDLITAICSIADSIAPNTGLARPVTHQVIFIERARRRRAFEAALPSLDDVARLDLRKKMMDEMEQLEWQVAVHHCAPNAPRAKPACRASLAMEQRMQLYHAAVVAVGLLSGARGGNTAAARGTAAALLDRALRQAHTHQSNLPHLRRECLCADSRRSPGVDACDRPRNRCARTPGVRPSRPRNRQV